MNARPHARKAAMRTAKEKLRYVSNVFPLRACRLIWIHGMKCRAEVYSAPDDQTISLQYAKGSRKVTLFPR